MASGTQESLNKSLAASAPVFKPMKNFQPSLKPNAAIPTVSAFGSSGEKATSGLGLESLSLNNDFTPSTPYVHKFRTEMCKNYELYGKCKYGDEVSKFYKKNERNAPIWKILITTKNINKLFYCYSVRLLMEEPIWWSKQMFQITIKQSYARSTAQMDTAHTVWDANSSMISAKQELMNNQFKQLPSIQKWDKISIKMRCLLYHKKQLMLPQQVNLELKLKNSNSFQSKRSLLSQLRTSMP